MPLSHTSGPQAASIALLQFLTSSACIHANSLMPHRKTSEPKQIIKSHTESCAWLLDVAPDTMFLHLEHARTAASRRHAAQRAGAHERARHARLHRRALARRIPQHGLLTAQQAAQRPNSAAA